MSTQQHITGTHPDETVSQAIQVKNLSKCFDDLEAVRGVEFSVRTGEIFGLLGPNGAGKTTTIGMLTGLVRPDKGSIRLCGLDCTAKPRAAQHLFGVVPDESNLYPELTGFENLCFCAALYGLPKAERRERAHNLLQTFGLRQAADRKFAGYSKGMKRKLTIAAGIIHEPDILFLDEPTTGIDVASARQVRRLVAELNDQGTTILLTTHYIEEAERLCDRIAFLVSGRVVRMDTVENLLQPVRDRHAVRIAFTADSMEHPQSLEQILAAAFPEYACSMPGPGFIRVQARSPIPVGPLIRLMEENNAVVLEAKRMRPSLEDVFISVTGLEASAMTGEKKKRRGSE
jgi:ABC-2 type transport system ATP-binding protein